MQNLFKYPGDRSNSQESTQARDNNDQSSTSNIVNAMVSQNQPYQAFPTAGSIPSQIPYIRHHIPQQQQQQQEMLTIAQLAERSIASYQQLQAQQQLLHRQRISIASYASIADSTSANFLDPLSRLPNTFMSTTNTHATGRQSSSVLTDSLMFQRLQEGSQRQNNPFPNFINNVPDVYAQHGILGPWSSTSAGLLGKIGPTMAEKKVVRRKPKDKPKRPLSAYNIFFKEERQRLLQQLPAKDDTPGDKKQKRKKVPHGKIGFESLAKEIGKRWQELDGIQSQFYKDKAAKDMKRYKEEMDGFLAKEEAKEKTTLDEEVSKEKLVVANKILNDEGHADEETPQAKKQKVHSPKVQTS
jgi:HMG-box domain